MSNLTHTSRFDLSDIQVVGLDLWRTMICSDNKRPIHWLYQRIQGLQVSLSEWLQDVEPNPEFLRWCDTTDISDPDQFCQEAALTLGCGPVSEKLRREFQELLRRESTCCAQYKDVLPALRGFKGRGYRLGVISNIWPFPVHQIFNVDGLAEYFEELTLSFKEGHIKPDPEIFQAFCRRLGVKPHQVLYVGDSLSADVRGALNAGMKAVLIDRKGEIDEEIPGVLKIRLLTELFDYLPVRK